MGDTDEPWETALVDSVPSDLMFNLPNSSYLKDNDMFGKMA